MDFCCRQWTWLKMEIYCLIVKEWGNRAQFKGLLLGFFGPDEGIL